MANTYTQKHIQAIVAVKFRDAVIHGRLCSTVQRSFSRIVRDQDDKLVERKNR